MPGPSMSSSDPRRPWTERYRCVERLRVPRTWLLPLCALTRHEKDGQTAQVWPVDMRKRTLLLSNLPYRSKGKSYRLLLALALVELGCVMRGGDPVSHQADDLSCR